MLFLSNQRLEGDKCDKLRGNANKNKKGIVTLHGETAFFLRTSYYVRRLPGLTYSAHARTFLLHKVEARMLRAGRIFAREEVRLFHTVDSMVCFIDYNMYICCYLWFVWK